MKCPDCGTPMVQGDGEWECTDCHIVIEAFTFTFIEHIAFPSEDDDENLPAFFAT